MRYCCVMKLIPIQKLGGRKLNEISVMSIHIMEPNEKEDLKMNLTII